MELNEMVSKGMKANSAQELKEMAAEQDWNMTDEDAKAYLDELQKYKADSTGELSDDELDDVSGGGCHKDNRLVVTVFHKCWRFKCICDSNLPFSIQQKDVMKGTCSYCYRSYKCRNCKYITYEKGLWLCNNPANMK